MVKLGLLLSFLLTTVFAAMGSEGDKYLGDILPIAIIPQPNSNRCQWYNAQKANDNVKCTCGDRTDLPLYAFKLTPELVQEFVPIVVSSSSEIAAAAAIQQCKCGDKTVPRMVFKPINDNYFLQYEPLNNASEDIETYITILYLKNIPKKSELVKFINTIEDFSNKNYTIFCDSIFPAEEN